MTEQAVAQEPKVKLERSKIPEIVFEENNQETRINTIIRRDHFARSTHRTDRSFDDEFSRFINERKSSVDIIAVNVSGGFVQKIELHGTRKKNGTPTPTGLMITLFRSSGNPQSDQKTARIDDTHFAEIQYGTDGALIQGVVFDEEDPDVYAELGIMEGADANPEVGVFIPDGFEDRFHFDLDMLEVPAQIDLSQVYQTLSAEPNILRGNFNTLPIQLHSS